MPLVKSLEILKKAKIEKKGVPAFNILSLETLQGIIKAAEEVEKPVIVQVSTNAIKWSGFEYIVPMVVSVAKNAKVDVVVHLDHCSDVSLIEKCVDAGFTSIMYDGSHFDLKKNIENSQMIISKFGHKVDIELEIGYVGGKEDDKVDEDLERLSSDEVLEFFNKLNPNSLAIAFGTSHGLYKGEINLDFDLVNKCASLIPAPLVMHGTSGVPFKDIKKIIQAGITKVNIGTDILVSYHKAIKDFIEKNPNVYDIRKINTAGINAIKERAKEYFKLFN